MKAVRALPLESQFAFSRGTEIVRIDYAPSTGLKVYVADVYGRSGCIASFTETTGFRVLDERDLMEYWPVCSTPNGWLFDIKEGGWLDQERTRTGSNMLFTCPDVTEYLVTGINECVSVFSAVPPELAHFQP